MNSGNLSKPIFRRIDYIRKAAYVPRIAPIGENPYRKEFGVLPLNEIQRLLDNHIKTERRRGRTKGDPISMVDVSREAGLDKGGDNVQVISQIRDGDLGKIGHVRLRKLCRVLLMLESGLLSKVDGKMVYADAPTKKPDMAFRVCLGRDGRATIMRGEAAPVPKQMPRIFSDFKLPGAR